MKNLIPDFIYKKVTEEKITEEQNKGVCLFLDIAGFSAMTEEFLKQGKVGAEILSDLLNSVFSPIITIVKSFDGFVATFAGDALTILFPENNSSDTLNNSLKTAFLIDQVFRVENNLASRAVSYKIGLSYGDFSWGIIGDLKKAYYFKGEVINSAANTEHKCRKNEILADSNFQAKASKSSAYSFEPAAEGTYKVSILSDIPWVPDSETLAKIPEIPVDFQAQFVPSSIINYTSKGEFRQIVPIFIAFEETENQTDLSSFIQLIEAKLEIYGGYLNCLDFGDKGSNCLIYFGAPVSYEDNLLRALNFIKEIRNSSALSIRCGINTGIALCWQVGNQYQCSYACLGDTVNIAARLMEEAKPGQVLVTNTVKKNFPLRFVYSGESAKNFKGISKVIHYYEIKNELAQHEDKAFAGMFCGRENELGSILNYHKQCFDSQKGGIVYLYGSAGIGKSRLVYEFIKSPECKSYKTIHLQSDSIIKKSFHPFSSFLNNYFGFNDLTDSDQRKIQFINNFQQWLEPFELRQNPAQSDMINDLKKDYIYILEILGIAVPEIEEIDPKLKLLKQTFFLRNFFLLNSVNKPYFLIIEDLHNFDKESTGVLEAVCRYLNKFQILLLCTSRYDDALTKPELNLEYWLQPLILDLDNLADQQSIQLASFHLQGNLDKNLSEFILNQTKGNPFFIEQFCLFLKEKDLITLSGCNFSLNCHPSEIPSSIQTILISRLDRLSHQLKAIVQLASVLGLDFSLNILFAIIDTYEKASLPDSPWSYMLEGQNVNIWAPLSEMTYIFKHALLKEAAYEMQLQSRLRELHGFVFNILKEQSPDKAYEIAYHAEKAEKFSDSADYYEIAGNKAADNYFNQLSMDCYDKVCKFSKKPEQIINANSSKARIYSLLGFPQKSVELMPKSIELALQHNLEYLELKSRTALAISFQLANMQDQAKEEALYLVEKLKDKQDREYKILHTKVLSVLGLLEWTNGNFLQALEYYEEDKRMSLEIKDNFGYSRALNNIGIVHFEREQYAQALEYYQTYEEISRKDNKKDELVKAYGNIATVYIRTKDYPQAEKYVLLQKELCDEIGDKIQLGRVFSYLGTLAFYKPDIDLAISYFHQEEELFLELGDQKNRCSALINLGAIYSHLKRYEEAINNMEMAKATKHQLSDMEGISTLYHNLALTNKNAGNIEAAFDNFKLEAALLFKKNVLEQAYNSLCSQANLLLAKKSYAEALPIVDQTLDYFKSFEINSSIFSYALFLKAQIMFHYDQSAVVQPLLEKAMSMLTEEVNAGFKQEIDLFNTEVCYYQDQSPLNQQKIIKSLQEKITAQPDKKQSLQFRFLLWKLTKDSQLQQDLLSELKEQNEKAPDFDTSLKIKELENSNINDSALLSSP